MEVIYSLTVLYPNSQTLCCQSRFVSSNSWLTFLGVVAHAMRMDKTSGGATGSDWNEKKYLYSSAKTSLWAWAKLNLYNLTNGAVQVSINQSKSPVACLSTAENVENSRLFLLSAPHRVTGDVFKKYRFNITMLSNRMTLKYRNVFLWMAENISILLEDFMSKCPTCVATLHRAERQVWSLLADQSVQR